MDDREGKKKRREKRQRRVRVKWKRKKLGSKIKSMGWETSRENKTIWEKDQTPDSHTVRKDTLNFPGNKRKAVLN